MTNLKEDRRALKHISRLSMKMTQDDPGKRPLIGEFDKELTAAGSEHFCTECLSQPDDSIAKRDETESGEARIAITSIIGYIESTDH